MATTLYIQYIYWTLSRDGRPESEKQLLAGDRLIPDRQVQASRFSPASKPGLQVALHR